MTIICSDQTDFHLSYEWKIINSFRWQKIRHYFAIDQLQYFRRWAKIVIRPEKLRNQYGTIESIFDWTKVSNLKLSLELSPF